MIRNANSIIINENWVKRDKEYITSIKCTLNRSGVSTVDLTAIDKSFYTQNSFIVWIDCFVIFKLTL